MISVRSWLVSGTFAVGIGAGMLGGAGVAAADSGSDPGTSTASVHATNTPQRVERGAGRAASERPVRAAAARTADSVVAPVAAAIAKSTVRTQATPSAAASGAAKNGLKERLTVNRQAAKPAPPVASAAATPATSASVVPSNVPVDPAKFAGTYYEQGSVKQFFSIGLVNTSATYTANPDGTIRVQNSGNYFFNRGPRSSIVGSAVPVNADNTALNVGFSRFKSPSATPPGNYTILANAPDYSWVIVSDPSGRSGYILTRSKTISPAEYQQLLDQARALGVQGRITPTKQYAA